MNSKINLMLKLLLILVKLFPQKEKIPYYYSIYPFISIYK
jgi:hypothetical protein